MTHKFILPFLLIFAASGITNAQQTQKKQLLPESKSIVGMWNQHVSADLATFERPTTGNYKVIAPDSTFYNFVVSGRYPTKIWVYGTISNPTDSSYTEEIIHATNESLIGKSNTLLYKLVDDNTLLLKFKMNVEINGVTREQWIPEIWKRVTVQDVFTTNKML